MATQTDKREGAKVKILARRDAVIRMPAEKDENGVYRELQKRLDRMPVGFPETASGVEIRILKHFFSPLEAWAAKYLSIVPEPLDRIYKRMKNKGVSLEQAGKALTSAASKGSIAVREKDGKKMYSLLPLAVGMYEYQVNRQTPSFAYDMTVYMKGEFGDELYRSKIPQLRTIPVGKTVALPEVYEISSYDNLLSILDGAGTSIAVINCICRQTKDIIGERCASTRLRETCFVFGEMAEAVVKGQAGRAVTRDEALKIIAQARADGLVVQPENARNPSYVCCCCGDCCGILTTVKRFPRPVEMFASNYYARIDPDNCTGCGTCVNICQMQAITLTENVAKIDLDRCIGCGSCAAGCKSKAAKLRRQSRRTVPPRDTTGLHMRIMSKKFGRLGLLKAGAKMALKRQV
jgi:electron transport complex protein RnfB